VVEHKIQGCENPACKWVNWKTSSTNTFIIFDQAHGIEVNGELRQRIAAVASAALASRQCIRKNPSQHIQLWWNTLDGMGKHWTPRMH
jgi:hypothetical protein